MATTRADSRKARLHAVLAQRRPEIIDEHQWQELRTCFAPISDSYLRRLLRDSGLPLAPLVEGVNQHTFPDLERTLVGLLNEYESGDLQRRKQVRQFVIEAKDRLKWSMKRGDLEETARSEKNEMLLWMMTWLENPESFGVWVKLRKARLEVLAPRHES